jgi:acetyl esterase/lipase
MHGMLVISLNYDKAPWFPFPTALYDVEALYLAAVDDESLPIDVKRIAVAGFSAGGNLALSLCQLPAIRGHARAKPGAVVPIYAPVNFSVPQRSKHNWRPYKPGLPGLRGERRDVVLEFADVFDWAYIPYGGDLRDPLLSPIFAPREQLPSHVFVIGAELDFLAFENMALACRLAGRTVPSTAAGRQERAKTQELELSDERFHWESKEKGVRWLLVPDVLHGFDLHEFGRTVSDPETGRDGDAKALKYMKLVGDWLLGTAWKP